MSLDRVLVTDLEDKKIICASVNNPSIRYILSPIVYPIVKVGALVNLILDPITGKLTIAR